MQKFYFLIFLWLNLCYFGTLQAQISLTSCNQTYNQNFNSLPLIGTPCALSAAWMDNVTIPGWYIQQQVGTDVLFWRSFGGGCVTGSLYNLGIISDADRALGSIASGSNQTIRTGARYVNQTGSPITQFTITYTGEQWKQSNNNTINRLSFEYSTDATSLSTGTWIPETSLDFIGTGTIAGMGTPGILNGNLSANRATLTQTITGLNIAPGAEFWIRWTDINDANTDAALGVDDFAITIQSTFRAFAGDRSTYVCSDAVGTPFSVISESNISSVSWSGFPPGTSVTGNGTPNITVDWNYTTPGVYIIQAEPFNGVCIGEIVPFIVTVMPNSNANILQADFDVCEGNPIQVGAESLTELNYVWDCGGCDSPPGNSPGLFDLSWSSPGLKDITLMTNNETLVNVNGQTYYNFTDFVTELSANCSSGINSFNSPIVVSGQPTSASAGITVNVNMTHTWVGDVTLILIAPDGQQLSLFNQTGGGTQNFVNTTFDDNATVSVDAGTAPYTGAFRPNGTIGTIGCSNVGNVSTLADFAGINPNGTWTLRMEDVFSGDFGILTSWSISFPPVAFNASCTGMNLTSINVEARPAQGAISGEATLCASNASGSLNISGNGGTIVRWEESIDGITYTPIANATPILNYTNLMQTTFYRVVLDGGGFCSESFTDPVIITVTPLNNGGTAIGDASYCGSINNGIVSTSGYTGSIIGWELSTDNFATFTYIPNFNDFIGYTNLTQTTEYRAVAAGGACPNTVSNIVTIRIDSPIEPGNLSSDRTVCSNINVGELTLSNYAGTITHWEYSTDNFITNTLIANNNAILNVGILSQTTQYRVALDGGACGSGYSPVITVTIIPVAIGGEVVSSGIYCANSPGVLNIINYSGPIIRWESSTDNFATVTTIANTTDTYNFSNLTMTTSFRAVISSPPCGESLTTPATITIVQNNVVPGILTRNQTDGGGCNSSATGTLTLSNYLGNIVRWESSTDNFVTITTISNITSVYNYSIVNATEFRVVLQNPPCGLVYSNRVLITSGMSVIAEAFRECGNTGKIIAVASGGTPPFTYVISPNSGQQVASGVYINLVPSTYIITVKDKNSCISQTIVKIPNKLTAPKLTGATILNSTTAKLNWLHVTPGNNVSYQVRYRQIGSPSWNPVITTPYNTHTLNNLMMNTDYEYAVRVRCLPLPTWSAWSLPLPFSTNILREENNIVDNAISNGQTYIQLFPNPAKDRFTLRFEAENIAEQENIEIRIYDVLGKVVFEDKRPVVAGENNLEFYLNNVASGIYTLQTSIGADRKTIKLIIE